MIAFLFLILLLIYIVINIRLNKYQISNTMVLLELLPILIISIFLERYQFIVNLLIMINMISLLVIPIFQLLNRKISILKDIKSRYFYVFTIIIYLYIFLLLIGKNQATVYENQIVFPSIIVISFSLLAFFMIKTLPTQKNITDLKKGILLMLINSGILFLISLISLIYYPLPIMTNCVIIGCLFLLPIIYKYFKNSQEYGYDNTINHIMIICALTFSIIGIIDIIIPNSAYLFINNNSIKLLNIGLYTSCLLTLPTLIKFKTSYLYDLLAFIIVTIIVYYLR